MRKRLTSGRVALIIRGQQIFFDFVLSVNMRYYSGNSKCWMADLVGGNAWRVENEHGGNEREGCGFLKKVLLLRERVEI